ncbi:asparagine synthase (glutamine-hydrolyzing) [Niabella sp. 3A5MI-3]|nr:asparagine synthase (glutamine-hydrolyzing) [Niabella beijingensis]
MCGFSGFIDYTCSLTEEDIIKSTKTLRHRGPDGFGYEFISTDQCHIGLGHTRLSIIDLSNNAGQPMWYRSYCIVFNGEIYNFKEIKERLTLKGHVFNTTSDTEVILHAYEEWDANMLHEFIGMFSIVIYDKEKHQLFIARDRAGVKPLYYSVDDKGLLFGSELKSLMSHSRYVRAINIDALALYLQYGYIPAPHSIFKKTYKLKPGHYIEYNISDKKLNEKQYWNVYDCYNQPELKIEFEEAKNETRHILKKAFQLRMVSDVPVGVFLSGGFDSTCVTALLQHDSTERLKTFTIGMTDQNLNEAPYAKEIAHYLGTDHTEMYCTEQEALNIIPDLPFYYDEPFGDSSAIPTILVSKIAAKDVKVALSADGGDEIFAGYTRYIYAENSMRYAIKTPSFLKKIASSVMDRLPPEYIPGGNKIERFPLRYNKAKELLKLKPVAKEIMDFATKNIDWESTKTLFKDDVRLVNTFFDSTELKGERFSLFPYMMAMDYQTYLVDDILQKVDRATMSVGLEGREPFLDQHIIEWAARLPLEYKYKSGIQKHILKEIAYDLVPKELLDRPKSGFSIPLGKWMHGFLKDKVDYYFSDTFIKKQGIFEPENLKALLSDFYNKRKRGAAVIWFILVFQMWYEKWMD